MSRPIEIVAAIADNGVIGRDNRLIWRLRSDLRRFRELTSGKPIIMGRRTWQSIGRPLPGRESIVLTHDPDFSAAGAHVAHSWDEAVRLGERLAEEMGAAAIAVIGGAEIYRLALPHADRLHLTLVHAAPPGDTLFPDYDRAAFRETRRAAPPPTSEDEHAFTFVELERRPRR